MASVPARYVLVLLLVTFVSADRVTDEVVESALLGLREAPSKTDGDTLNLPANASSIRENITDTFSCENRTYGYYADVDNDCQVFHVCLPSQTPSGRNVTYRWSFICPNETIFNQEVLTCTRVADSIDCKDSPDFYHLNMEIGKIINKTDDTKDRKKQQKRQPPKKKENIIMENIVMGDLIKEIAHDVSKDGVQGIEFGGKNGEDSPVLIEAVIETAESDAEDLEAEPLVEEEISSIVMDSSERDTNRGMLRYGEVTSTSE